MSPRFRKLRPAKIRSAVRRRWFERRVRPALTPVPGLTDVGTPYGGWTVPGQLIDDAWLCYCVGAGGDVSFDLALIDRYGATVRSIEPVAEYVEEARRSAAGRDRFSTYQAAVATADGPTRMQVTHDPRSRSLSAAGLYDTDRYVEVPGRRLESLMAELGDDHIDLLKLDIEGSEYDVVPTLEPADAWRPLVRGPAPSHRVRARRPVAHRAGSGAGLPTGGGPTSAQDHVLAGRPVCGGDPGVEPAVLQRIARKRESAVLTADFSGRGRAAAPSASSTDSSRRSHRLDHSRHRRCPGAADPAVAAHYRRDAEAGSGGRRMTGTRKSPTADQVFGRVLTGSGHGGRQIL